MSLTKGQRRQALDLIGMFFEPMVELPPSLKDKFLQDSRDEIARKFLTVDEYLFRLPVAMVDGDRVPVDWQTNAYNVYYMNGGNVQPLTYLPPEDFGTALANSIAVNSATNPYYWFSGLHFHTLPAGLSCSVEYYQKPTLMFNYGTPISDSTTDMMPADTEPLIIRGGYARCLMILSEDTKSVMKINKEDLMSTIRSNDETYKLLAESLMRKGRDQ
jgi:hypothetical protein